MKKIIAYFYINTKGPYAGGFWSKTIWMNKKETETEIKTETKIETETNLSLLFVVFYNYYIVGLCNRCRRNTVIYIVIYFHLREHEFCKCACVHMYMYMFYVRACVHMHMYIHFCVIST